MSNVSIDATLVTCQTDIQAKAGDMILVFEGNCLGVYRGLVKVPAATPTVVQRAQPASPSAKVAGASDGMDLVPAFVSGPKSAMQVGDWLRLPRDDKRGRSGISYRIRCLNAAGVIRPLPGTVRNHVYELVKASQ